MERSASNERTMVRNERPSCFFIAASALPSSDASVPRALNTTLPLERTVFTSAKPAASKHFFSSGIFAFIGLTPRRNAAYRGMATLSRKIRVGESTPSDGGDLNLCGGRPGQMLGFALRPRRRHVGSAARRVEA